MTKYKVALPGNRWKRGFTTQADAVAYEGKLRAQDGVFRAVVAYKARAVRGADVRVVNHGSVVMVHPVSDEAKAWVEENVSLEGWQWLGGGFAVEPRYVDGLVDGMMGDGLVIE